MKLLPPGHCYWVLLNDGTEIVSTTRAGLYAGLASINNGIWLPDDLVSRPMTDAELQRGMASALYAVKEPD